VSQSVFPGSSSVGHGQRLVITNSDKWELIERETWVHDHDWKKNYDKIDTDIKTSLCARLRLLQFVLGYIYLKISKRKKKRERERELVKMAWLIYKDIYTIFEPFGALFLYMSLASFCWLWFGPSVAFPACSISMALTCSLLYLFFFIYIYNNRENYI